MGGGYYDGDVARRSRRSAQSSQEETFAYRGGEPNIPDAERKAHAELDPKGVIRECMNETPIVVALDVTRSRGDDSRVVYNKLPTFIGEMHLKGYVGGPAVSFCAIGDGISNDKAPLQVSQFEADNRLDAVLSKVWLEEGGGGTGQEGYDLAAYFYARRSKLACLDEGRKGFFFFIGDEGFYPTLTKEQVKKWIGDDLGEHLDSAAIFAELQAKYEVFLIFPQKSWEARKADIDAEIKKRVEAAGGLYKGVDIRMSLIWNNRNDLDLRVITPSGEEIYYGDKKSQCGGWLDVDMNISGETTKPVENIRWATGNATKGHYRIVVQNYGFHEAENEPTSFQVEIEINNEVQHFEGVVSPNLETGGQSNVTVYEFDYDPSQRPRIEAHEEAYAAYDDAIIKEQWAGVIPPENILLLDDPEGIIDVMLGVLALKSAGKSLDEYLDDMESRGEDSKRIEETARALVSLDSDT